jgi:hypothetical protein
MTDALLVLGIWAILGTTVAVVVNILRVRARPAMRTTAP